MGFADIWVQSCRNCLPQQTDNGGMETPKDRSRKLHAIGYLTASIIELALNANEREFMMVAIALRSGVPVWGVTRIKEGSGTNGVTTLCWKAGISESACYRTAAPAGPHAAVKGDPCPRRV